MQFKLFIYFSLRGNLSAIGLLDLYPHTLSFAHFLIVFLLSEDGYTSRARAFSRVTAGHGEEKEQTLQGLFISGGKGKGAV